MAIKISAAILAGGAASRFNGILKPRIVIDGETIISRTLAAIRGIFDEIMIVTNSPGEFDDYNECRIVQDEILNAGPLGGIHAALKSCPGEAVFVFGGDMPFLDRGVILKLIGDFKSAPCDVLIPCIGEYIEPLHSIYNISLAKILEEYLGSNKDKAVRQFVKTLNVRYVLFEGTEAVRRAFININSPSDIQVAAGTRRSAIRRKLP